MKRFLFEHTNLVWQFFPTIIVAFPLLGCGTFLSVKEIKPNTKDPGGVVVNKHTFYKVEVKLKDKDKTSLGSDVLSGIDELRMLSINAIRMPFASGTLALTVTPKEQVPTEIAITSDTGAVKAIQAADTIVKTRTELKKKNTE